MLVKKNLKHFFKKSTSLKRIVREMSGRENVLLEKCPIGELSGRGVVRSGKCLSGICPRGSVSRGTVQSGNSSNAS